jgi:rubrerythrin
MSEPIPTTDAAAEPDTTRREAMRRGLLAGGTLAAVATVPALLRAQLAFAQSSDDIDIIKTAAEMEIQAVVAYDTLVKTGFLRGPVGDLIRLFRDQEQEHYNALARILDDNGEDEPDKPQPADIPGLGGLASEQLMLSFAIDLENGLIKEYVQAFDKLEDADLLKTTSQIMSNEGQHLVMLRLALGADPVALVPSAFETGTDPAPQVSPFGPG